MADSADVVKPPPPPLRLSFLTEYSKIDEEEARKRALDTVEAVKRQHHVYRCMETFMFTFPRISLHSLYPSLLPSFSEPSFTLLELGACFGTDARKLLLDGLPASRLVVTDLHDSYWEVGNQVLFHDPDLQVAAVFGDLAVPVSASDLVSVNGWEGRFDAVSAQAILHVFTEQQCSNFLAQAARCLKPGGVLFGTAAVSAKDSRLWGEIPTRGLQDREAVPRFLHNVSSLKVALEGCGLVDVKIAAREVPPACGLSEEMQFCEFSGLLKESS